MSVCYVLFIILPWTFDHDTPFFLEIPLQDLLILQGFGIADLILPNENNKETLYYSDINKLAGPQGAGFKCLVVCCKLGLCFQLFTVKATICVSGSFQARSATWSMLLCASPLFI